MNADEDYFEMLRRDSDGSRWQDEQERRDREQTYYPDALAELRSRISHLAGPSPVREGEW